MIYFNRPALVGNELKYIQDAVAQGMLCGDGKYTKLCSAWMKERFQVNQVFLTTSCTHAAQAPLSPTPWARAKPTTSTSFPTPSR